MQNNGLIDIKHILMTVWRYYRLIGCVLGGFIALALLYILITPSRYTAETLILLDRNKANVAADLSSATEKEFESSFVESQVEIVKSRKIAAAVLETLGADEYITALANEDVVVQEQLIGQLNNGLRVGRVGTTYVLSIRYTTLNPLDAANIANAYANAYMLDQVDSGQGTSATGAEWLQKRLGELRDKSVKANEAVQEFRKQHNLYEASGESINESQLAEMNNQLGAARAEAAAARARYEFSQKVLKNKDVNAAIAEALDNDVINTIRANYLESKKRLSELVRTVGDEHISVKNMRQSIREYESLIFKEMERLAQSQHSAYQVALAREDMLEKRLKDLIDVKSGSEGLMTQLRGLQKEADTHEALYESYLEKFEAVSQRQSFPLAESRVISEATMPLDASHPRTVLILGVSVVLGLGMGVLFALYREFTDHGLRTASEVREMLGTSFLGFFPMLDQGEATTKRMHKKTFEFNDKTKTETIDNPFSIHSETARKTKAYIDRDLEENGCKIIGVISSAPNEGKSTVAANLALAFAKTGASCLLIDADVRNPTIRQEAFDEEIKGLGDVFAKDISMGDALIREARTGLAILPALGKSTEVTLEHINPVEMGILLKLYAEQFRYIVLDLPPVTATSDVYSLSPHIDHYVVVAEWGKTQWDKLETALKENDIQPDKVLGVVLNKADMEQLIRYYDHKIYAEYTAYSPRRA